MNVVIDARDLDRAIVEAAEALQAEGIYPSPRRCRDITRGGITQVCHAFSRLVESGAITIRVPRPGQARAPDLPARLLGGAGEGEGEGEGDARAATPEERARAVARRAVRDYDRAWRSIRSCLSRPSRPPEPTVGEKWCPRCAASRPLASFSRSAGTRDGYQGYCKSCQNIATARSRARSASAISADAEGGAE